MSVVLYGIKSCDAVRKARAWLDAQDVSYAFHDFRVDGLDAKDLTRWVKAVGWEKLLNRSSSTFRGLSEGEKADLDERKAMVLMLAHPTAIKRPVLTAAGSVHIGFTPANYDDLLSELRTASAQ